MMAVKIAQYKHWKVGRALSLWLSLYLLTSTMDICATLIGINDNTEAKISILVALFIASSEYRPRINLPTVELMELNNNEKNTGQAAFI